MTELQDVLDQIDRLDAEATKGPWVANDRGIGYEITTEQQINEATEVNGWPMPINYELRETFTRGDAEFIASSRTALPQLAGALRAVLKLHEPFTSRWKGNPVLCSHCTVDDYAGGVDFANYPCGTVRSITEALEA